MQLDTGRRVVCLKLPSFQRVSMTAAFIFPGQGSQSVGMGKALADNFVAARNVFEAVDETLGQKLTAIMWDGPADRLTLTENAHPARMAAPLAASRGAASEGGGRACA